MGRLRSSLRALPLPLRWGVVGLVVLGMVGVVGGATLGLLTYAPTAGAAAVELGLPGAVLGGMLGLAAGGIAQATRRRPARR